MNSSRKDTIFYTIFKEHDEVSLQEAFSLSKRDPQSKVKNRQWIGYKLPRWRKKGLVEATYGSTAGSYGDLVGIKLTELGKKLVRNLVESKHESNLTPVKDILEMVRQLKRAHPEWEINFEVRLKEQSQLISSMVEN
jgi:hypothetical protein